MAFKTDAGPWSTSVYHLIHLQLSSLAAPRKEKHRSCTRRLSFFEVSTFILPLSQSLMAVGTSGIEATGHAVSVPNMKTTNSDTSLHLEDVAPTGPPKEEMESKMAPTDSPQDPRNWPQWKKDAQILMVAFHSMMGTFMAAGIVPAYEAFAEQYNVTVPTASYLTSVQVRSTRKIEVLYSATLTNPFDPTLDLAAWPLAIDVEPSDCYIRTLQRHLALCLWQHGVQYWRGQVHFIRCSNGYSRSDGLFDLSSHRQWKRRGDRTVRA